MQATLGYGLLGFEACGTVLVSSEAEYNVSCSGPSRNPQDEPDDGQDDGQASEAGLKRSRTCRGTATRRYGMSEAAARRCRMSPLEFHFAFSGLGSQVLKCLMPGDTWIQ